MKRNVMFAIRCIFNIFGDSFLIILRYKLNWKHKINKINDESYINIDHFGWVLNWQLIGYGLIRSGGVSSTKKFYYY